MAPLKIKILKTFGAMRRKRGEGYGGKTYITTTA